MPGYIKVSGEQRPVAAPYLKANGEWKPVVLGYIKVAGEWKIWHAAKIEDTFTRADSSSLGIASNGFSQWNTLVGSWTISGNQAVSPTASGYAIAIARLYKATPDFEATVDTPVGSGTGISFWVEDAANWWAAYTWQETINNPAFYSCPTGYTLNGTTCTKLTYLGVGNWNPPTSGTYWSCADYPGTSSDGQGACCRSEFVGRYSIFEGCPACTRN